MQASKHYIDGFLNADDEANQVAPNEAVRVVNMRFTERRRWESIASNVEKVNPFLPASGNTAIGWLSDEATRSIILFNYNASGSGIYFYNGTWYKVLTETQVTGGLNFQKNSLITARLVNGLLTWTDNVSEPKSISIYSALRANSTLPVPVLNTVTTSPTGGTLAANTYSWTITALSATGETSKSNQLSVTTTGATSTVTLNWSAVAGATGYRVYRGTSPVGQDVYFTVGAVTTFTDTGTAPTTGQPPTINTSATYVTTASAYVFPIRYESSTIIRRPPVYPLIVSKLNDTGYTANNIENEAFQFLYYYEYRNGQISALSPYSKLIPFNFSGEQNNAIDVSVPLSEKIDEECLSVNIVVKKASTGKMYIIRAFDKNNDGDASTITEHNKGSTGATSVKFLFYNDVAGLVLDNVFSATAFHPVALKANTLEIVKNRLFLGGLLSGYNAPTKTSISATTTTSNTASTGSFAGQWNYVTLHGNYDPPPIQEYSYYPYVTSSTAPSPIYYFPNVRTSVWDTAIGSVPASVIISDGVAFATLADLVTYLKANYNPPPVSGSTGLNWQPAYETTVMNTSGNGTGGCTLNQYTINQINQFFKSNGTYEVAVCFYDRFRRKCGVVKGVRTTMPARTYAQASFTAAINWSLTNVSDMTAEIPSWAYYYQIHITKNLTTRNFIQAVSAAQTYVTKNANGTFTYATLPASYTQTTYAIGIDISKLNGFGIGYTYTAGDFCRIYLDSPANSYNLAIIGQDGNYIHLRPKDIGSIASTLNIIFEIYTPYKSAITEPYYETGAVYNISNPGTSTRSYTTLTGKINGDTYSLQRAKDGTTNYIAEAMSPNDNLWSRWMTDTGWENIVTTLGQENKPSAIQFSDTFVEGTRTNGLNVFQPLNQETLPISMGGLQKLILTSKVEEEGNVMLAIGKNQTASIYIGETQVTNADTTSYFVKSTGVISQVNILKGDFGTQNPESVVVFKGDAYWIDTNSGRFIEYSINGLDEISAGENGMFKFKRFTKGFCAAFNSFTSAQIEANGSRPFIFGGVDPHFKEILWTIPYVGSNPKGSLVDYSSVPTYMDNNLYPYDTLDYSYKTISFRKGIAKWQGEYSFASEGMLSLGSDLYSLKNGKLYLHNAGTTFNNFYGTPYRSKIAISLNKDNVVKEFRAISIESSEAPEWVHFRSEYPYEQSTDLIATDFISREGIFDGGIMRDRLTPNSSGYDMAQVSGDLIRSQAIYSLIQFNNPNTLIWFRQATVGYNQSSGHY